MASWFRKKRTNVSNGPEIPMAAPSPAEQVSRTDQELTVLPSLRILGNVRSNMISDISMEFAMTIQPKVTKLTTRQASMLLSVLVVRSLNGVDISMYLAMEFLRNVLVKSGHDFMEQQDERVRMTLLLSELVLTTVRGKWITLTDYEKLPDEVTEKLVRSNWLPNTRTLQSWIQYWEPEKFLQVRIVPVEHLYERAESETTERYSGYTKGYGNDGNPGRLRTPYSSELDGVQEDPDPPGFNLERLREYQELLLAIERQRALKSK